MRLLLKQYDRLDWITSPYPYLPRSPERTEGWKDINLISEHGNYPASAGPALMAHTHAGVTCVLWRDSLEFVISGEVTSHNSQPGLNKIADAFLCSQVTNHSFRDKMLVFNQTVLL